MSQKSSASSIGAPAFHPFAGLFHGMVVPEASTSPAIGPADEPMGSVLAKCHRQPGAAPAAVTM